MTVVWSVSVADYQSSLISNPAVQGVVASYGQDTINNADTIDDFQWATMFLTTIVYAYRHLV